MADLARWGQRLMFACTVVMFAGSAWFVATRGVNYEGHWQAVEVVTVVLTALAIILAAVTIFLASLAIWGYATLRSDARSVAASVAADVARAAATREAGPSSRLYQGAVGGALATPEESLADALRSVEEVDDAGS